MPVHFEPIIPARHAAFIAFNKRHLPVFGRLFCDLRNRVDFSADVLPLRDISQSRS